MFVFTPNKQFVCVYEQVRDELVCMTSPLVTRGKCGCWEGVFKGSHNTLAGICFTKPPWKLRDSCRVGVPVHRCVVPQVMCTSV